MAEEREFFTSNHEYLSEYLKWIDMRIASLYEIKTKESKDRSPLKGLVISNEDIKNAIFDSETDNSRMYNILNDEVYLRLKKKTEKALSRGIELKLEKLCQNFNLNTAEKIFILMAAAPEINSKYEKIYGYFNDNINKTLPCVNFAIDVLGIQNMGRNRMRESFLEKSSFRKYILHYLFGNEGYPLFSNEIKIDEKIVNYLLDINEIDRDIKNAIFVVNENTEINIKEEKSLYNKISLFYSDKKRETACIFLYGDKGSGKKENIKLFCKNKCKIGIIVNLKLIISNAEEFKISMKKSIREAIIEDAVLAFDSYENISLIEDMKLRQILEAIFLEEIKYYDKDIFILSTEKIKLKDFFERNIFEMEVEKPKYSERIDIWNYYFDKYNVLRGNIKDYSTKFSFTPNQIKNTVLTYKNKLITEKEKIDYDKLVYESCFEQVNHDLYKRASKVSLNYSWEQLILPEEQKSLLLDACNQVENKYRVYDEWGFEKTVAYGRGVTVVCSGPPGTGKTMAAQVMASKLNLEMFKVDLSQIVSKYVGETEKNLNEIFNEAKMSNAILFFDEADALFGKRSEVKSSNDRYSNLETSYLLQKIEEYGGVSILATNYLKNIDDAFIRRMKYIINFPFPDAFTRKEIWKTTIPDKAPVSADIDFDFLAEEFELSGGNIKNILLYAAFLAAAEKSRLNMRYILKASKYEMQKIGKLILGQDLKQYRYLLDEQ